ncbi:sensor histidine kinase [Streptomyces fumanus]|uniref:sensor histidine kinase n=1 Tax=Streptomyces fumanus TaxID=67302 RepID=UPI00340513F9
MSDEPSPGPPPSQPEPSAESRERVPKLLEVMRCVGSGTDPRTALDRIRETAAALTGARYAAIGVTAEDGERLADFSQHGTGHGQHGIGHGQHGTDFLRHGPDETADHRTGPAEHPPPRGSLGVPIRVRGEVLGTLRLADKRGGEPFDEEDLVLARVLAAEAGIALGNARLYEAARQRERWIDGSVAVTTALLSGDDTDDALQVVAEQARRLSGAAAGVVLLPVDGGGLEIAAVSAPRPPESLGTVVPPSSGIATELLAGRSVRVDDAATDPRLADGLARAYGPTLLLPLCSDGRVLGGLVMARARGERPFTRAERDLADGFAAQAALALMVAEAQRDRERLAVLEDRDRIARDLHDLVIQRLFATGMLLADAQRGAAVAEVGDGVGRAVDGLDVTIQEIRSAVFALRQPAEEPSGLRTRVQREIAMAAVPLGFTPAHRWVGPVDSAVGETTGKNLIAALREALSNAFRHAGASRIEVVVDATVTLPDGRPGVRLTVADDGVGLRTGGRRSGLRNLERRAESLGGASRTGPGIGPDGAGTTVVWEAPY